MRSHVRGWGPGAQERFNCTPSTFCGRWLGFNNPRCQPHLHREFSVVLDKWASLSLNLSLFICEMDYTYPSPKVGRSKKGHSALGVGVCVQCCLFLWQIFYKPLFATSSQTHDDGRLIGSQALRWM